MSFTSSTNVMNQLLTPDEMRGRMMSLFTIIMQGGVPAGTLILGAMASAIGMSATYVVGGAIGVIAGVWVWMAHPSVRKA
jgi:predicted MFS family arabinose efflux permease